MKFLSLSLNVVLLSLVITSCSETEVKKKENSTSEIEAKLVSILPKAITINSIEETDIEGYFEVNFEETEPLYVSENGKYLISGDIFQITSEGLVNKSESRRNFHRKTAINQLNESEFIIFKPETSQHSIFVFTDVDCGYCRQFHNQIDDYLDLGIQVNYLAFPRAGLDSFSFSKIASAWCSEDPNAALTLLKLGGQIEENICLENPVERHFKLGGSFGVSGTPSIVTSEGKLIPGYLPPRDLIKLLDS